MLDEAKTPLSLLMIERQAFVDVGLLQVADPCLLLHQSLLNLLFHPLHEGSCLHECPTLAHSYLVLCLLCLVLKRAFFDYYAIEASSSFKIYS
jgi:hypothetical protein